MLGFRRDQDVGVGGQLRHQGLRHCFGEFCIAQDIEDGDDNAGGDLDAGQARADTPAISTG